MTKNNEPKPLRQMAHDAASSANLRTALSARADSVSSANLKAELQKSASSANLNTALASPAAQAQTVQKSPAPAPTSQPSKS